MSDEQNTPNIREVVTRAFAPIIARNTHARQAIYSSLDSAIRTGTADDIARWVGKILEADQTLATELRILILLTEQIPALNPKEGSLAPDTQIIKDLPDLLEDSGGVD